jgi:hypothetical protein
MCNNTSDIKELTQPAPSLVKPECAMGLAGERSRLKWMIENLNVL